MSLHPIFRNVVFVLALVFAGSLRASDWTLEHLATDKSLAASGSYADPNLAALMDKVFNSLKGSWCSKQKAKLIMEIIIFENLNNCVEIGTFTGSSALPILASLSYLKQGNAYLIDAWSNQEAIKGLYPNDPNTIWWSSLDMNAVKNQLLSMIKTWNFAPYCTVIQAPSEKALSKISSIDFLHLDGNFSEQGSLLDSLLYLPLVRSGGYILISNVLVTVNQKPTKMKALWPLFEQCDIVSEIEHGNVFLFRKK